jgi:hypothetical protein
MDDGASPNRPTVNGVVNEYSTMDRARCECGATGFRLVRQMLITGPAGSHYDLLEAVCKTCGAPRTFWFDVSGLFPPDRGTGKP